ncbi:MAG: hypothetical protein AAF357_08390 [Verrucomicrobiota bacterium]
MQTTQTPEPEQAAKANGQAQPTSPEASNSFGIDNKVVIRLQDAIDEQGRYAAKLKDISVGYALGKGVSEHQAKTEIGQLFTQKLGVDLKGYLEQYREERGLPNENSQQQSNGRR